MTAAPAVRERPPMVEWAVGARALEGEPVSGDLHVVTPFPGGVLVAVMDGLGHGTEAAAAAEAAAEILRDHAQSRSPGSSSGVMTRCGGRAAWRSASQPSMPPSGR